MSVVHTDVGAYALGLLEEDDRRAFEEHLAECPSCAAEVDDFAGVRDLLAGIGPIDDAADAESEAESEETGDAAAAVIDLLNRRREAARRRRRGSIVIGIAAGAAIAAGGITVGSAITGSGQGGAHQHGSPITDLLATGERHSASDPATHAAGTVATRGRPWGTEVALDLGNIHGPLVCRLVAVTRSGRQQPVSEWAVPDKGYGVPGSPAHLQVHGQASAPRSDIVRFDVDIVGGGKLLSIPV